MQLPSRFAQCTARLARAQHTRLWALVTAKPCTDPRPGSGCIPCAPSPSPSTPARLQAKKDQPQRDAPTYAPQYTRTTRNHAPPLTPTRSVWPRTHLSAGKKSGRTTVRWDLNSAPGGQELLSVTGQPASVEQQWASVKLQPSSVNRNPATPDFRLSRQSTRPFQWSCPVATAVLGPCPG